MKDILPQVRGKYRFDVDLSKLCWFGVGGKASVLFTPADQEDLIHFLQNANEIPIFVFGLDRRTETMPNRLTSASEQVPGARLPNIKTSLVFTWGGNEDVTHPSERRIQTLRHFSKIFSLSGV